MRKIFLWQKIKYIYDFKLHTHQNLNYVTCGRQNLKGNTSKSLKHSKIPLSLWGDCFPSHVRVFSTVKMIQFRNQRKKIKILLEDDISHFKISTGVPFPHGTLHSFKMLNVSVYWTRCFESRRTLCLLPPSFLPPMSIQSAPWGHHWSVGPHTAPTSALMPSPWTTCFFYTHPFLANCQAPSKVTQRNIHRAPLQLRALC